MMNKQFFIIMVLVFFATTGRSQEYLTGFVGTPQQYADERVVRSNDALVLPFFDDFTEIGNYPSKARWIENDRSVVVNSGFPYLPVNYRAATFDLIDKYGEVYSNGSSNPFIADSLMSVAIQLDSLDGHALTPADSLYLSFYYQAGGYGNRPDDDDSLVLCFGYCYEELVYDSINNVTYTYEMTAWRHVWSIPGEEFDSTFTKVMIPITDPIFFKNKFYILFYNYGTLPTTMYPNERSNMDIWNIDCVYLNTNRSVSENAEDSYPKIGLTGKEPQFLKRYKSMPYNQYKEMSPEVSMNYIYDMHASNLDSIAHEVEYICTVEDVNTGDFYSVNDTTFVLGTYSADGIQNYNVLMKNFRFNDSYQNDSTSFIIRQYINVVDQYGDVVAGDSIVSKQGFYNYFAYDDGTPEKGYGLVPDDSYFATQFNLATPDKIYGVQLLFNHTFNDANYSFFDIYVYGNNGGKPGEIIYQLENQYVDWSFDDLYGFKYYKFEKPVQVSGTFYIGIHQQESKTINIGFDASNDNKQYIFYNVDGTWKNTSFAGSLMIRPMIGKEYFLGSVENQVVTENLSLYPNPVRDVLHIDGISQDECQDVVVYDVAGRVLKNSHYCNELNVSDLTSGIYVLRVMKNDGSLLTSRFVVSK